MGNAPGRSRPRLFGNSLRTARGGKQYVAILAGLGRLARTTLANTPELREMRNQTMLFVFAL